MLLQRFFFEGMPPRLLGVTALALLAEERDPDDVASLPAPMPDVPALLARSGR